MVIIMITIKDIQTAVSKLLTKNSYYVIAAEVKEGFQKPACFVDVMPVSIATENKFYELVTLGVEISYHPAMETKEELISNAENMKNIFLYTPIKVADRYLSVNEITFDSDKSALITYFELEFLQETNTKSAAMPKMKTLNERVVTDSRGTSENFN